MERVLSVYMNSRLNFILSILLKYYKFFLLAETINNENSTNKTGLISYRIALRYYKLANFWVFSSI